MTLSLTQPDKKITHYLVGHPELMTDAKQRGYYYPISAEIDLTWRCALNCKGCHSKWLHQGIELDPLQIERILAQLKSVGCKTVTWSGGGDPLESPHWQSAMNTAELLGFRQAVYTYMPQPSQGKVDFIESHCDFAYTHPFKTNGLVRGIKRECTWTAGFLLDSENWARFPRMVESVDLEFFNFVDFRPLCPTNQPDSKLLNYSWVAEFIDAFQDLGYSENPKVKMADYKFRDLLRSDLGRDYASCLSTDFVACIGPNGDMYECINRRGFTDSVLGNLLHEDIHEIWERKSRFREDFTGCRILCRNHEMNRELYSIMGPAPKHECFV
jgi:MoaA/NifB/PqqE/SkfB family radical SAM enzyme